MTFLSRATLRGIQNSFEQHRQGMVGADTWLGYEALLRQQVQWPVVRDWWKLERAAFDPEFRAKVDRVLAEEEA